MISWLQINLQKHFRYLFIVLLGVVIVAFVFTIGAAPGIGDGRNRQAGDVSFFEFELGNQAKQQQFFNDAFFSAMLQGGMQVSQEQLNQYAFNRATALHLANTHNIPAPTQQELTEHIQSLGRFLGPDGSFNAQAYAMFRDETKASGQISEGELARIMADDFRVNKIYEALSGPGYVLESEVIDALAQDQTQWTVKVAEVDLTSFSPEIDSSDEALEKFFNENDFRYRAPSRRVISFVEFNALDHLGDVEIDEEALKNYFARNSSKYTKEVDAPAPEGDNAAEGEEAQAPQPIIEPATFEEAREQVVADYKLEEARKVAQSKAETLARSLFDADNASGLETSLSREDIVAIIAEKGFTTNQTTPFARNERPLGMAWSQNLIAHSYQLSENQLYSQPIVEGNSTFVLYLENENPEFLPSFITVRARVLEDYTQEETRRLRTAHCEELTDTLRASGAESFQSEAEAKGMTVTEYADFTRLAPAEGLDRNLLFSISSLEEGQIADATIREDKGYITQVVKKTVPEISDDDEAYATRLEALKSEYERFAVAQYISKLTSAEFARAGLAAN